jgi:membrane protein YdbS with pleckstrin-like domain
MHRQDVKAIYHTYLDHVPLIKIILFSLVVLGIVILASVLVYQLSGSLNWTYFTAGILIMLAVVGSIIILS